MILFCFAGDTAAAVNYDEQIKDAEEKQKQYEKQSEELQEELQEIESDKNDTLKYIEQLDKKTEEIEKQLEELQNQIEQTEGNLETAQQELSDAQAVQEKQYMTMKQRIKYMYENGNQDYFEILFSSSSMAELLNRTEYIEKISSYDKNVFDEYQKITEQVEAKKKEIEDSLQNLEDMKGDADAEKEALASMREKKKKELKSYNNSLEKTQEQAEEYAKQAIAEEKQLEKLLQAKQREEDLKNDMGQGNSGSGGTFRWPLNVSGTISSGFGKRSSPTAGASTYHKGVDIAVASGTPIVAAASGTVVTATYSSSAGNYIMISHGNRMYTVYMHCSRLAVDEGTSVQKGDVIGYVGSTGISTGSHLHFGISKNGSYVNPLNYVSNGN
jgi:murein DD-endopeptidase MepM/ murein hydrolase activator NlpD